MYGLAIFIGHCLPIFHEFKGGKELVVALTLLTATALPLAAAALAVWILYLPQHSGVSGFLSQCRSRCNLKFHLVSFEESMLVCLLAVGLIISHHSNIKA